MELLSGLRWTSVELLADLFAFLAMAKIEEATSVCTGGSNTPPGCCIIDYSNLASQQKNKAVPAGTTLFLELLARFELATSSLPRMRSTD